jgi:hypothetical protein
METVGAIFVCLLERLRPSLRTIYIVAKTYRRHHAQLGIASHALTAMTACHKPSTGLRHVIIIVKEPFTLTCRHTQISPDSGSTRRSQHTNGFTIRQEVDLTEAHTADRGPHSALSEPPSQRGPVWHRQDRKLPKTHLQNDFGSFTTGSPTRPHVSTEKGTKP